MRFISFRIKNFKSIIDTGECHLSSSDNILVLAGQNEAGKSAVIEALDFFYNGPSKNFERLHRRREEHPEVICKFQLDDNEIEELLKEFQVNELARHIRKNPIVSFVRGDVKEDSFDEIIFSQEMIAELSKFFPEKAENDTEPTDSPSDPEAKSPDSGNVQSKTLDDLDQYFTKHLRESVSFESFDSLLPGVVTISDMSNFSAVLDFQKVFNVNFSEVIKKDIRAVGREELRINNEASDNLNTYWTQRLDEGGKYNFRIKIIPRQPPETSEIEFKIDRSDGDPLFMEQKSKGFRWFSAFNLRLRALGVDKQTIKNLVILIDEPGQGLHEKAQRDVKEVVEELAAGGAQIIYSTHYPNLIGTEGQEFARIRLVSNTVDVGTKVETVAQFASRAEGATDALSPLITAMGIHSVQSLLSTNRLNVVVEGISDHYYFSVFKKLLKKDDRIYFLPACGVSNIPNLVSVLIGWGCNYKAIFDDDPGSGRKAYNLLKNEFYEKDDNVAHEHVLKIKDCNGIED